MPPQFLAVVLIMVLASSLYFTKIMLDHKRKEIELRGKYGDRDESGKSLTESELSGLIREAVREETTIVLERMKEVEERLDALDRVNPEIGLEEGSESERKTLGRTSRLKT